jgi:cyclic pyranopterin monophosphate synthase
MARAVKRAKRSLGRSGLTHLTAANTPTMVDVSQKGATYREARASATVTLPARVARALNASGHRSKKGPIFDTAIIAGVMAAKRTHELIPFCHPLALERCSIEITARGNTIVVTSTVGVTHKTGVEMEALTGCSVAALTIYDMCKALSHDIAISEVRLLAKSGGKHNFERGAPRSARSKRP